MTLKAIKMPQMGVSDESAILSKWLVREGDRVRKGQPVFSLETDKATFQYESESDGILVRILTGEGEEVAVGSPVGILSDSEGKVYEFELAALLNERNGKTVQVQVETESHKPKEHVMEQKSARLSPQNLAVGIRKVSPRAKKKAYELGVNLKTILSGSGPKGRIIERDVQNAVQTNRSGTEIKLKMAGIWSGRPLTIENRINMRQIRAECAGRTGLVSRTIDARKILAASTSQNKLTPGMVVCHELARLLAVTPELNARRHGGRIYEYNTVHLRLNVKTSSGTLKPVIRCAEAYTTNELAELMCNASGRCSRFVSKPQEFQEGTFTVADLGGFGIDFFTPELTPPELCALGIGTVAMQIKADDRGGIEAYPAIRLTLAYDRAGIDAIRAAEFLNELAVRLEPDKLKQ